MISHFLLQILHFFSIILHSNITTAVISLLMTACQEDFTTVVQTVDRSLPASCIAHEVLCLASICRSYLTQLVFANRFFDRNVFCPPVDCQLYFTHSYFACGTLPVITLPICILPAEGKTLECEVHTGKIRWAKYDWQNTHGQSTRW